MPSIKKTMSERWSSEQIPNNSGRHPAGRKKIPDSSALSRE